MIEIAALLVCVVLLALVGFQVALAAGAPLGRLAWGGQHEGTLPVGLRVGSALSVLVYGFIAWLVLARAGLAAGGEAGVVTVGIWVVVGYLAVGTLMNLASRSRSERVVMTPVAAVLCLLCLVVAIGGGS